MDNWTALMKENNIIEEKSFEFAVRVVNLYKYLTSEKQEFVMSKQFYDLVQVLEQM